MFLSSTEMSMNFTYPNEYKIAKWLSYINNLAFEDLIGKLELHK